MKNVAMLNDYQLEQMRGWLRKMQEVVDLGVYTREDQENIQVDRFEPFPCEVPGIIAVVNRYGNNLVLLYPAPGPVPKDPLFQHAGPVTRSARTMAVNFCQGRMDYWRNFGHHQFDDAVWMDAPEEMPAGSCYAFSIEGDGTGRDVHGAYQSTFMRGGDE